VLYHRRHEPNSGLNHVDIFLRTSAPPGRWRVALRGREVVDGRLHAWIERDARGHHQSRFARRQATSRYTTNTICNSFRAIAVGAYDGTRPDRPAAVFSSRGPTADGRQKPELVAPGYRILAARSLPASGWSGQRRLTVKSGTSMAAPWVSGTVALMFQAAGRPLTIHEVRSLLIGTADPHPGPSGRTSTRLGYGYLNITAAVEAARRLASESPTPPPSSVEARELDSLDDGAGLEIDEEAPLDDAALDDTPLDDAPLDDALLGDAIGEPDTPATDLVLDEDLETPMSIDELHEAIEASSEMEW
jgi:subtilisin family serine protease